MSIMQLLGVGSVSLGAHRTAAATASNNLNNVNTAGYARQRGVTLQAASTLMAGVRVGGGAYAGGVSGLRDILAESRVGSALAGGAQADARAGALTQLTTLNMDAPGGVQGALAGFFSAWRGLSQNAGSGPLRQAALSSTGALATAFNQTARDIQSAQSATDASVVDTAREVQEAAQTVARLNVALRSHGARPPPELLDARQAALDTLAEKAGARVLQHTNGDVTVQLQDGTALVSGDRAARVQALADPANNGFAQLRVSRLDGSGVDTPAASAWGGKLGGLLTARDVDLQSAMDSLDTLANDLADALNTTHAAGTAADGTSGHALLDTQGGGAGAALRLRVHADVAGNASRLAAASSAGTLPGGADNALALVGLQSAALASGATADGQWSNLLSQVGTAAATALSDSEAAGVTRQLTLALREATSGVSTDEETVMLMQAQRAFEASMKVISTADSMLEELMRLR